MWQRILRLLSTGLNMYGFYRNPFRFILTLAGVLLIPYAAYLFWGSVIFLTLTGAAVYVLYRFIKRKAARSSGF